MPAASAFASPIRTNGYAITSKTNRGKRQENRLLHLLQKGDYYCTSYGKRTIYHEKHTLFLRVILYYNQQTGNEGRETGHQTIASFLFLGNAHKNTAADTATITASTIHAKHANTHTGRGRTTKFVRSSLITKNGLQQQQPKQKQRTADTHGARKNKHHHWRSRRPLA